MKEQGNFGSWDAGSVCNECGFEKGHRQGCLAGQKEFEEWQKIFGGRALDLSSHASGPGEEPPKRSTTPAAPAAPKPERERELPKQLATIRDHLINDILKFSYNFATDKGKVSLREVFQAKRDKPKEITKLLSQDIVTTLKSDVKGLWTEEEKARHFDKMKAFIFHEFRRTMDQSRVSAYEWKSVVVDLVRNIETYCADIERRDEGAVKIMKNLLIRMFLTERAVKSPEELSTGNNTE